MSGDFVGRVDKLEKLRLRLANVDGDRLAKTVLVSGDAGIGKSRLLEEFADVVKESGAHLLRGSCDEHLSESMPYWPLMEAFDGFKREYGAQRAAELGGPPYELLSRLFNATEQPAAELGAAQVFLALRQMLDRIGDDAALVLMIEDLHWADLQTLGLLTALARARPEGRRLLLVGSHRPSDLVRDTALWKMLSNADFLRRVESLPLAAFTPQELREFLERRAGEPVPDKLVARLMELSDGVPFYAEQLMAANVLDRDDVVVPPTLQEIMEAQVADATEDTRKVLRVSAVAGRRISHFLLRPVSGLQGDALTVALDACLDRRMLVPDQAGSAVYRFRHALLRAEMYRRTAQGTRVELHEAMAEAIAANPRLSVGDRATADAEEAYHWHEAGRLPEALGASARAARAAVGRLAYSSAEQQFARVLELWNRVDDPAERAGMSLVEVLIAAADAARWAGHLDAAVAHIERAVRLVDGAAEPDLAGFLHERLGNHLWEDEQRTPSDAAYGRAAQLLDGRPDSATKSRVVAWQALHELRAGNYTDGQRTAEAALRMARAIGARAEEGRALTVSGLARGLRDDIDGGAGQIGEALRIAEEVHNHEDLFRAYSNLCLVLEHGGRLTDAAEVGKKGLAEARQVDLHDSRQGKVLANNVSTVLVLLGRWDEAEAIITDSATGLQVFPRLTLAEVQVGRGEFDKAGRTIAALADEEVTDLRFLGPFHAVQAEAALWRGDPRTAAHQVRLGIEKLKGGENGLELLRLCTIGLRAAAELDQSGDELSLLASEAMQGKRRTAEIEQLVRVCAAERQRRLGGRNAAATWAGVAQGWAELDRRYPAAYARWREAAAAVAEQRLDQATEAARAAHTTASALAAIPLQRKVEQLAKEARLDLAVPRQPTKRPYHLTPTEFEVLRLRHEHLSNAEIAKRRSCSVRTVETHLDNAYAKMSVHSLFDALHKAREERFFSR